MLRNVSTFVAAACLVTLVALDLPVSAQDAGNPYQPIIERNAFGLKPPPPQQDTSIKEPPPPPLAKVSLTGITSFLGTRALLVISEQEPGKGATTKSPILREGEREGPVEVLSIDVANNSVRIRNGTVETNLTFEQPKSTPSPAGGPGPGAPMVAHAAPAPVPLPLPGATQASSEPTIITRNSDPNDRSGINVYGGTPAAAAAPTAYSATRTASSFGAGVYGSPTAAAALRATDAAGLGMSIPARTSRIENPQQQGGGLDPVTQWIALKAYESGSHPDQKTPAPSRRTNTKDIPYPPAPPMPGMGD